MKQWFLDTDHKQKKKKEKRNGKQKFLIIAPLTAFREFPGHDRGKGNPDYVQRYPELSTEVRVYGD